MVLVITFRPEFEAPWVGHPHVTPLAINQLGHRETRNLIDRVVGNKPLPDNIRKDIIERTDCIPLFIEEMTRAVLEAGGKLEAMQTMAAFPSPKLVSSLGEPACFPDGSIASAPSTPSLRREEIKLQVALLAPLKHIRSRRAANTGRGRAGAFSYRTGRGSRGAHRGSTAAFLCPPHTFYWTYLTAFDGHEAEAHRIAGEVARMWPERDTARAEAYFERALAVARQQRVESWELRAAMRMARLWRDQGQQNDARELLAPIYSWFTEGFDTPDLNQAKALLVELA